MKSFLLDPDTGECTKCEIFAVELSVPSATPKSERVIWSSVSQLPTGFWLHNPSPSLTSTSTFVKKLAQVRGATSFSGRIQRVVAKTAN